ncbi:uncharacterized protein V1510DRAFT_396412 [Dipodascopsis tothii]|uniref:uncharacterized protein n=1 Tax=Dipodascopsis tothii TaxID=44089 RepID=UPI0034CE054D
MVTINIRGPPNADYVFGFPGIPASWPRISGVVEVRGAPRQPFRLTSVTVSLYRTEKITVQTKSLGLSQVKRQESYLVGSELAVFNTALAGEQLVAVDLPFTYELPVIGDIPPSFCQSKIAETVYQLYATVNVHGQGVTRASRPITIYRYDKLSIFGIFKEPKTVRTSSPDHVVMLAATFPRTSFGPNDVLRVIVDVLPNPDLHHKSAKAKMRGLTLELVELATFNVHGDAPFSKPRRVRQSKVVFNNMKVPAEGYRSEVGITVPVADTRNKDGHVPYEFDGAPNTLMPSFSMTASLYSIEYCVNVHVRMSGCKDVELSQKVFLTPFDAEQCQALKEPLNDAIDYAHRADHAETLVSTVMRPTDADGLARAASNRTHLYIE